MYISKTSPPQGPKSNPAHLDKGKNKNPNQDAIFNLFSQLFRAAVNSSSSSSPIRFLSRYDKSACNIKESAIWTALGQVPWAEPVSDWYHAFSSFPFAALEEAARLGEYTLTDRGTWLASPERVTGEMMVFVSLVIYAPTTRWFHSGILLFGPKAAVAI